MSNKLIALHRRVNRLADYLGDDGRYYQDAESFPSLLRRLDILIARVAHDLKVSKAETELYQRLSSYGKVRS